MRNLASGFVLSVLLHGLVLYICFHSAGGREPLSTPYTIALYPETMPGSIPSMGGDGGPDTGEFTRPSAGSGGLGTPVPAGRRPVGGEPGGAEFSASTRYVPVPDTSRSLLFAIGRHGASAFTREVLVRGKPTRDIAKERVASWFPSTGSGTGWTRPPDPTQEYLKKSRGAAPTFPLSGAASMPASREEKKPPRFDFIPNSVQLDAMTIVGRMANPTQLDIYANLNPSFRISADLLNGQLEVLVSKGFLSRKKISPENLLSVGTLFGGTQIEMSGKNRLNPLYAYALNVDKTQILRFIDAQIFVLKEILRESPSDSLAIRAKIAGLETALLAMVGGIE